MSEDTTANAPTKYCNQCGKPEHGSAACTFEHWDKWPEFIQPIEQGLQIENLLDQISDLKAQIAEKDKEIEIEIHKTSSIRVLEEFEEIKARAEAAEAQLAEYKVHNYDPAESIRLNSEIMKLKLQLDEAKQWKDICVHQTLKLKAQKAKLEEIEKVRQVIESDFKNCFNSHKRDILIANSTLMWDAIKTCESTS
jgi:hypothetical protein